MPDTDVEARLAEIDKRIHFMTTAWYEMVAELGGLSAVLLNFAPDDAFRDAMIERATGIQELVQLVKAFRAQLPPLAD